MNNQEKLNELIKLFKSTKPFELINDRDTYIFIVKNGKLFVKHENFLDYMYVNILKLDNYTIEHIIKVLQYKIKIKKDESNVKRRNRKNRRNRK